MAGQPQQVTRDLSGPETGNCLFRQGGVAVQKTARPRNTARTAAARNGRCRDGERFRRTGTCGLEIAAKGHPSGRRPSETPMRGLSRASLAATLLPSARGGMSGPPSRDDAIPPERSRRSLPPLSTTGRLASGLTTWFMSLEASSEPFRRSVPVRHACAFRRSRPGMATRRFGMIVSPTARLAGDSPNAWQQRPRRMAGVYQGSGARRHRTTPFARFLT